MLSGPALGKPPTMTLWTIQTFAAWEKLQRSQVLVCNPRYSLPSRDLWSSDRTRGAYAWMVKQMRRRLEAQSEASFPLWGWYQYNGIKQRKPDLRRRAHLPKGTRGVRIEFEAPEKTVLLSDFDLWHFALNYYYLPENEADDDAFERLLSDHNLTSEHLASTKRAPYHQRIQASWECIFDLTWEEEYCAHPYSEKSIQATFWKLHMHQIRDVKVFTSR